jgi:aryl-alcohol dehydrogenase-like predicted oxidoreductase
METSEPCHLYNVKLLPYGVLAGGFLSGKYLNGAKPEGARFVKYPGFQYRYATKAVEEAAIKYKALAEKKGLSLTQLAVAWYVQQLPTQEGTHLLDSKPTVLARLW